MITGFLILLFILIIFSYYGAQSNYFFSDDFEWLSRGIISQSNPLEIIRIKGRDFNPLFIIITSILIKFFGLSPFFFRVFIFIVFFITMYLLYTIISRVLKVNDYIALVSIFLLSMNVYVSEILLNYSASVYLFAFLFFLIALYYYNKGKYPFFILFFIVSLLFKEVIFLGFVTFLFVKRELKGKIILIVSLLSFIIARIILQTGSSSNYTSFISSKFLLIKIYFIFSRSININPYSTPPLTGFIIIILFFIASVFLIIKNKNYIFPFSFFYIYLFFFSLFPKLSSRYLFLPAVGFILFLSIILNDLAEKYKKTKIFFYLLIIISFLYNLPLIKKEVQDYKILGDFSKHFIEKQKISVRNSFHASSGNNVFLRKGEYESIKKIYRLIQKRGNLPKLLPVRKDSIGGVIYPEDLIPIVLYPKYIAKWETLKQTKNGYYGKIVILNRRKS